MYVVSDSLHFQVTPGDIGIRVQHVVLYAIQGKLQGILQKHKHAKGSYWTVDVEEMLASLGNKPAPTLELMDTV